MKIRLTGIILFTSCNLAPLYWYLNLLSQYDTLAILSQYLGSVALISMAFSQLLATRASGLETLFGGLDRIYVLHKWIGIIAISAILLHDTIDAEIDELGPENWLSDLAETLGEFSLYALLILLVISLVTVIPYPLWRFSHKFMGCLFALSSFHYIFMLKPFSMTEPLGAYILAFCIMGLICYAITLLPFKILAGRSSYRVTKIHQTGDSTAIELRPSGRGIKHLGGQFCFLSIQRPGLQEPHPFTISCAPNDQKTLQITIKALGDYTRKLATALQLGDSVQLSKAFGHFQPATNNKRQIWIASGIGITPFLAWLEQPPAAPITLYYSYRGESKAPHLQRLKQYCEPLENVTLCLIDTLQTSRLSTEQIVDHHPQSLPECEVYYCGPTAMRDSLRGGLNQQGLKHRYFHYEAFELRTGVNLSTIAKFLQKSFSICYKLIKKRPL